MAKRQIEIDLSFNADASHAKAALQDLQRSMNNFWSASIQGSEKFDMADKITQAQDQMVKLNHALRESVDVESGKFDLSKFQTQLKQSGISLADLRVKLSAIGPEGQKAFLSLTKAIMTAETPTRKMGATLDKFAKTLKDTARWQLSSNIVHGLEGALQSAYNYAKDLNRSLTDIQIVTGHSADYMEEFAVQANKAAKELSATTNEYAKASLIYFQQGLSDEEVAQRTSATIKLAHAAGESANEVSSYMTAIWNNFDNGTQSLEYYADVITALGAATASSSEEIATGMQKFAAVADTVGLSYEYATAALATVTATTRESAETVGTAFKTIFARLESLSLGETLDDNTNLTKYSQALERVGVNIKDAQGNLVSMDEIIDQLGNRWNSISKDQQIALAQTVAGMRQYNNFMALMANYDFFEQNVKTAEESTGTLQEQQEIYEKGWEAASDRVKASLEEIYQQLVDDDFFIELSESISGILGFISELIDSLGGVKGILFTLSAIVTKLFNKQIREGFGAMANGVKSILGINTRESMAMKEEANRQAQSLKNQNQIIDPALATELEGLEQSRALQQSLLENENKLTDAQKRQIQDKIQLIELQYKYNKALAEGAKETINKAKEARRKGGISSFRLTEEQTQEAEARARQQAEVKAKQTIEANIRKEVEAEYENVVRDEIEQAKGENGGSIKRVDVLTAMRNSKKHQKNIENEIQSRARGINYADEIDEDYYDSVLNEELNLTRHQNKNSYLDALARYDMRTERKVAYDKDINALFEQYDLYEAGKADKNNIFSKAAAEIGTDGNLTEALKTTLINAINEINQNQSYTEGLKNYQKDDFERVKIKNSGRNFKNARETIDSYRNNGNQASNIGALYQDLESIGLAEEEINAIIEAEEEAIKSKEAFAAAQEKARKEVEDTNEALNKAPKRVLTMGESFLNLSSILASLTGAVYSLKGAWETIKDPDATPWEKVQSIFGTLITVIPLVVTSINTLKAFTLQDTLATTANSLAKMVNAKQRDKVAKSADREGKEVLESAGSQVTEAAAEGGKAAAKVAPSIGASLKSIGSSLVALGPVAIGVVAAIVAIGAITAGAIAQVTKASKDAEAAMKNAKQASEDADKAANAYKETVNTIANYQKASEGLDKLTKGTKEWKEQLEETNAQAKELINNNAYLRDKYTIRNGQYIISEEALEEIERRQEEAAGLTQAYADRAQANALKASNREKTVNLSRNLNSGDGKEAIEYLKNMGITGLVGGVVGLAAGAIATAATGVSTKTENDTLDKLADELQRNPDLFAGNNFENLLTNTEFGLEDEDLRQSLLENKEEVQKLVEELATTNREVQLLNESSVANANRGNTKYQESEYQELINVLAAKEVEERAAGFEESLKGEEGTQKLANKFLESRYGSDWASSYRAVDLGGGDITIEKKNDDGNWETVKYGNRDGKNDVPWDEVVQEIALAMANELDDTSIQRMENMGQTFVAQLGSFGVIDEDIARAQAASYYRDGSMELSQLAPGQLKYIKGDGSEIGQALEEAAKNAATSWQNTLNEYGATVAENINRVTNEAGSAFEEVSRSILEKHAGAMSQILTFGGNELAVDYNNMIDGIITANRDHAEDILEIASNIDWTNKSRGLQQLWGELYELGIYINENDEAYITFAENLSKANVGIKLDLKTIREELQSISEIVDKIEPLSIVSDEDYRNIIKYNGELAKSFIITAEGYKYIGDTSLSSVTAEAVTDQLDEMLKQAELAKQAAAVIEEAGTDDFNFAKAQSYGLAGDFYSKLQNKDYNAIWAAQGYSRDKVEELLIGVNNGDQDAIKEVQSLYNGAQALPQRVIDGEFDDRRVYETIGSSLTPQQFASWTELFEGQPEAHEKISKALELERKEYLKSIDVLGRYDDRISSLDDNINSFYGNRKKTAYEQKDLLLEQALNLANEDKTSAYNSLRQELNAYGGEELEIITDSFGNIINANELLEDAWYKGNEEAVQKIIDEYDAANKKSVEYENAKIENILASSIYLYEFGEEVISRQNEYFDWTLGRLEDTNFSLAESLTYIDKQYSNIIKSSTNLESALDEIGSEIGVERRSGWTLETYINRILKEAPEAREQIEALADAQFQLLQDLENTKDLLQNSLLKYFQDIADSYDTITVSVDRSTSSLTHYKNIAELAGEAYSPFDNETLNEINNLEKAAADQNIKISRAKYESLKKDRERYEEELNKARESGDKETIASLEKSLDEVKTLEYEALQEMQENYEESLKLLGDLLLENADRILRDFEKDVTSTFGTFEQLTKVFEQRSEQNDRYVADYEKIYQLSKLTRNIQDQIDNTDNVKAKSELRALQEEMNQLQASGVEMSQYDLEYLQKKYDLRLAEIALEEAQNAKSQVRLQKMADGSWGYVYTQNAEATENAQQNYEDKLYALQELSTNYLDETSSKIVSVQAEFQDAIREVMSSGLTEEEAKAEIERISELYEGKLLYLTDEFNKVIDNNQGLNNMAQSFSDTILGTLYPEYNNADDIYTQFYDKVFGEDGVAKQLTTAQSAYAASVKEVIAAYTSEAGGMAEDVATNLKDIQTLLVGENGTSGVVSQISALQDKMKERLGENNYFSDIINKVLDLQTEIDIAKEKYAGEGGLLEALSNAGANSNKDKSNIAAVNPDDYATEILEAVDISSYEVSDDNTVTDVREEFELERNQMVNNIKNDVYEIKKEVAEIKSTGNSFDETAVKTLNSYELKNYQPYGYNNTETVVGRKGIQVNVGGGLVFDLYKNTSGDIFWARTDLEDMVPTFDTGGYTGSWGPSGRLAVLHEKELVLNKTDTANFLQGMNKIENLLTMLDSQIAYQRLVHSMSAQGVSASSSALQQEVTIHAEFPNATNHSEIEQAFDNLINRAAQYINRNTR